MELRQAQAQGFALPQTPTPNSPARAMWTRGGQPGHVDNPGGLTTCPPLPPALTTRERLRPDALRLPHLLILFLTQCRGLVPPERLPEGEREGESAKLRPSQVRPGSGLCQHLPSVGRSVVHGPEGRLQPSRKPRSPGSPSPSPVAACASG